MTSDKPAAAVTALATVFVPVADQDRALAFYIERLGFEKRSDFAYGDGHRWVEVAPPGSGMALALVSRDEGVTPPSAAAHCALATDDLDGSVALLRTQGVEVEDVGDIGGSRHGLLSTDVIIADVFPRQCCFRDPDGNRFLLVQPG